MQECLKKHHLPFGFIRRYEVIETEILNERVNNSSYLDRKGTYLLQSIYAHITCSLCQGTMLNLRITGFMVLESKN